MCTHAHAFIYVCGCMKERLMDVPMLSRGNRVCAQRSALWPAYSLPDFPALLSTAACLQVSQPQLLCSALLCRAAGCAGRPVGGCWPQPATTDPCACGPSLSQRRLQPTPEVQTHPWLQDAVEPQQGISIRQLHGRRAAAKPPCCCSRSACCGATPPDCGTAPLIAAAPFWRLCLRTAALACTA